MSMADIRVTPAAQAVLDALSKEEPEQERAVLAVIRDLGSGRGEPLDIPAAPPATPFLALETSRPDAPVVVYRRTTPEEPGDWLVVSLLSPEEYRNVRRAEEVMAAAPAVREIVGAIVGGTVATANYTTPPRPNGPNGGAVPTTDPGR